MDEPKYLTIKELPPDERPRERLEKFGSESLSDSELLAIMLRTGARNLSASDLAKRLLQRFDGLRAIASASLEELCELDGIGKAKAIQIKAAFEIGRRFSRARKDNSGQILTSEDVKNLVWDDMHTKTQEEFRILLLDTKNRLIRDEKVTVGILDASIVHPREVFKSAIKSSAASVIIVHNHPSGDPTPSRDDVSTTRRLREAGELVGISVLDHVIIGEGTYYSFKDNKRI